MSSTDPDPENPQVDDPGEYNQRQRLREIAEARRNARQALADTFPNFSEDEHREFALKNVQALAAELEWLVRESGGSEYFTQTIGTVVLSPPDIEEIEAKAEEEKGSRVDVKQVIDGSGLSPTEMPVQGLYTTESSGMGFIDLPPYVSDEWDPEVDIRHEGPDNVPIQKGKYIPLEIPMAANRLCRKFIHEAGLDARIEEETDSDPNPI